MKPNVYYTYKLLKLDTGHFYYGFRHSNSLNPYNDLGVVYKSSGSKVKEIGFDKFIYGVVNIYSDGKQCWLDEQKLIKENRHNTLCLNEHYVDWETKKIVWFGTHSEKTKRKIGEITKLRGPRDKKTREKISKTMKGRVYDESRRNNISHSLIGRKLSAAHIEKVRETSFGRKHTEETKRKIGSARLGAKQSAEARQKMREAKLGMKWKNVDGKRVFYRIT